MMRLATLLAATVLAGTAGCSGGTNREAVPSPAPRFARRVELVSLQRELSGLRTKQVTVADPVYKKTKRYEGYALVDVLRAAFGSALDEHRDGDVVFVCSDGYRPIAALSRLDDRAVVAVRDLDAPPGATWTPITQGREQVNLAPYYLVWSGVPLESADNVPWPYGLVALELRARDASPVDFPPGTDPAIVQGSALFQTHCAKCHSVNLTGGALGPELNVPQNVTEYWTAAALRSFIEDPAIVRAGSKMPAFPDLSDGDVSTVIAYLTFMKTRKIDLTAGTPAPSSP